MPLLYLYPKHALFSAASMFPGKAATRKDANERIYKRKPRFQLVVTLNETSHVYFLFLHVKKNIFFLTCVFFLFVLLFLAH